MHEKQCQDEGRLKKSRLNAGFKTASAAIETLNWHSSTYRAHENGQNNFKLDNAKIYAKAYGVSASWLIMGDETNDQTKKYLIKRLLKKLISTIVQNISSLQPYC
jgi:hypothetical protein